MHARAQETLRQKQNLLQKEGKLSSISNKLRKKDLLNSPEWRQVQAWVDTRNSAAHGKFSDYAEVDVKTCFSGKIKKGK